MDNGRLTFTIEDDGEEVEFFVLEQTRLNGRTYILVADSEDGDGDCLILRETEEQQGEDVVYEVVEDDGELESLLPVFEELLEDVDLER